MAAFRLATSGVADATQIHTHLCYSEFGEIIATRSPAWTPTSPRSRRPARAWRWSTTSNAVGFGHGVGPGVYDIHSPRVPGDEEIAESLRTAVKPFRPGGSGSTRTAA